MRVPILLLAAILLTIPLGGCRLMGFKTDEFGYCTCGHPHQHKPAHHLVPHEHPEFRGP